MKNYSADYNQRNSRRTEGVNITRRQKRYLWERQAVTAVGPARGCFT